MIGLTVSNLILVNVLNRGYKRIQKDRPREIAYEVFSDVIRKDAYSNLTLPQRLQDKDLDVRDRAFITELVYGSIRQIRRNDYILSEFVDRDWESIDPDIVDVLRLGAYQLFDMRVPAHAAVDATVNLAKQVLGESKASFVNALMRKISSKSLGEHLIKVQDDSVTSLSIRYSHPEWIINSYRDFISDIEELKALLTANNTPVAPTLVAWPGKSTQSELVELGCQPTQYSPYGAISNTPPADNPYIQQRKAGVQDEGSQLLAIAFSEAAKEHQPWLDLCAGPGGKAALLSHLTNEKFYANEISNIRADLIKKVVSQNTEVSIGDGRDIKLQVGAILADVPCTGLGALRRRPEIRWRRNPADLAALTKLQFELSAHSLEILPSGGVFGYATCSPHMAETAAQCATFEKKFPIEKIDVTPFLPKSLTNGIRNGFMQLWPHRHGTDAMFLALYRKR